LKTVPVQIQVTKTGNMKPRTIASSWTYGNVNRKLLDII